MRHLISTTDERRLQVYELISDGSNPRRSFFLLVALSSLIACFGLLMNSTAVVIGAMLVAPLMTPILGVALSLVRGDSHLLGNALRSEVLGVIIAIGACTLLGVAIPYFEPTAEMLSRTQPNLLDLFVAVLAGLAGAYAMVDEKVSPVLPGVAISTAIVPPLANVGLSLSLGAWEGAWGSFLLFFTNFLSILLASALVFYLSGLDMTFKAASRTTVARRFGLAITGFLVVGILLSFELSRMIGEQRLQHDLNLFLRQELTPLRVSDLSDVSFERAGSRVIVLAHVDAPRVISPRQVRAIEERAEAALGVELDLYMRTTLTHDVSATGGVGTRLAASLDGLDFDAPSGGDAVLLRDAEQAVREYFNDRLGFTIVGLQSFHWGSELVIIAEVSGLRELRREEIAALEDLIRARSGRPNITFGVRLEESRITLRDGRVRTEFSSRRPRTEEEQTTVDTVIGVARAFLEPRGFRLQGSSLTILEDGPHLLLEATGPRLFTREELMELQADSRAATGAPIKLYVRSLPENVVSEAGTFSLEEMLSTMGRRTRAFYETESQSLIEGWR